MTTVSIHDLGLKPSQFKAVARKARHIGKTPPEYIRALVERELLADESFDDILQPVRNDIQKSGLTPQRLDDIVECARNAIQRKRPRSKR